MANPDVHFKTDSGIFRLRVVALIIRGGKLLAVRDADHDSYYTVGGRIQLGESSEQAVIREAFEETGLHYEIDRLLSVQERFFDFMGAKHHEVSFYYLMKDRSDAIPEGAHTDHVRETLHWLPLDALSSIHLIPESLKDDLKRLPDRVEHRIIFE